MASEPLASIYNMESHLWEAADQLRANSKLTSSEYCTPVCRQVHMLERYNIKLREARDLLLPRLMSGEVAV